MSHLKWSSKRKINSVKCQYKCQTTSGRNYMHDIIIELSLLFFVDAAHLMQSHTFKEIYQTYLRHVSNSFCPIFFCTNAHVSFSCLETAWPLSDSTLKLLFFAGKMRIATTVVSELVDWKQNNNQDYIYVVSYYAITKCRMVWTKVTNYIWCSDGLALHMGFTEMHKIIKHVQ